MLSKEKTRKAFSRAAPQYDQYATWQQKIARLLVNEIKSVPKSVLDLGCGTGEVAFLIKNKFPKAEICGLDIAEGMIIQAEKRSIQENKPEIIFKVGDMEHVDYPAESFDLVISNLSLQWLNDLQLCFKEVRSILKPEGRFLFSTVLKGSQKELTAAYKKTFKQFPHQHIFKTPSEILNVLKKYKFKNIRKAELKDTLYFSGFKQLAYSMKNVGAKAQNAKNITRSELNKLEKNYPKTAQGLAMTYVLGFISASL